MDQVEFQAALEALRQEYVHNLPNKVSEIRDAWLNVRNQAWDASALYTLTRLAHSLAGSGATYGFEPLSQAARALELYLKPLTTEDFTEDACIQIEDLIARIDTAAANVLVPETDRASDKAPAVQVSTVAFEQVFLYEPEPALAEEIETHLGFFDFTVISQDLAALASLEVLPVAAIINWDTAQLCPEAERSIVAELHKREPILPIVFLSQHDDLPSRLNAVRNGATAYLIKPLSMDSLIETVDTQTGHRSAEPFRILIIEDDENLAARSATILEHAGMVTHVITDPLLMMQPLIDFHPDLILSDMHMPNMSGLELAAVLRQQEAYVGIPIVFLSSETDINTQLSAMLMGGDDFLLKPIEAHHLVGKVTSRVQRARTLRGFAERDSLTGLLNHTRFKERLGIETIRAQRTGAPVAFAMLDIDHFKRVNDTYGHSTGDRVIKSLARLLTQRLRRSDVLGRYGGEEFAIIFPDTNEGAAYQVLDEIRRSFEQIHQFSGGQEFQVTFSGGGAALQPFMQASELSDAADRALYQAKRGGRNQIVVTYPE